MKVSCGILASLIVDRLYIPFVTCSARLVPSKAQRGRNNQPHLYIQALWLQLYDMHHDSKTSAAWGHTISTRSLVETQIQEEYR